jgi:L-threonylcarbamoyladenylate synthase
MALERVDVVERAVAALRRGELIGLPTETVYGLAGDASNPEAINKIFALKGRPSNHPLIVHVASLDAVRSWTRELPPIALELAERFWPGPLTLILRKRPEINPAVTGGQDSVGIRIPRHPLALSVLEAFGRGLAAPSANRFGHISPTTAQHVRDEFGSALPMVLDGGPCELGLESAIVDCTSDRPRVLRPGMLSASQLKAIWPEIEIGAPASEASTVPRVSGSMRSHYAPRTPAELVPTATFAQRQQELAVKGARVQLLRINPSESPHDYARKLYARLRRLDQQHGDVILIEQPPDGAAWHAILDRLSRACARE